MRLSASVQGAVNNASQLNSASAALAANSTYGVWATEFSKEALFYVYESSHSSNSTRAQFYSDQAYTSAMLASQLSNDTRSIYQSLVAAPQGGSSGSTGLNSTYVTADTYILKDLAYKVQVLTSLVAVALALIVGCVVLIAVLTHKILVLSARIREGGRRKGR